MSTSVKFITNVQRGAPALSGTAGTLISVLDALLVSGWGITSAVSVTVSGGVATATLNPGETFDREATVLVAGATPSALNGESKVKSSTNTSITWDTTAPDGAATGSITIKYAPQSTWSKVFAATNKAVYRSTHVQSSGHYLRVDDTGTTTARVRGYETMSDVDTGIGPFPTDAQMSGGSYWWKSTFTPASAVKYRIFCDERFLLLCVAAGTNLATQFKAATSRGFGDPIALAPGGDAWATVISGSGPADTSSNNYGSLADGVASNASYGAIYSPRAVSGLGSSVMLETIPQSGNIGVFSGADGYFGPGPSAIDGQIKISRRLLRAAGSGNPVRAVVPGVIYIPQSGILSSVADGDVFTGAGDMAGRRLLAIASASGANSDPTGLYLVDITGPWR